MHARDVVVAGLTAGTISGLPSTLTAVASGADPLEPTLAAGSILLPHETSRRRLLVAAVPLHFALSLAWTAVLARVIPRREPVTAGAAAGLAIAALDLCLLGRRVPRIRALPLVPQLADHVVFGASAAWVLASRRAAAQCDW